MMTMNIRKEDKHFIICGVLLSLVHFLLSGFLDIKGAAAPLLLPLNEVRQSRRRDERRTISILAIFPISPAQSRIVHTEGSSRRITKLIPALVRVKKRWVRF